MTTMVTEIYDALKDAGASDEKARAAAEAVAVYDRLSGDMRQTRADVALLKGLVGINIALSVVIIAKQFFT